MKKKQTAYHHGNLREALVACAQATIAESGVKALSLRQCARTIGVDPSALYQHFKSKDALLEEIARLAFVRLAELMERNMAEANSNPREKLLAVGLSYVAFAQEHPALFGLMFEVSARTEGGVTRGSVPSGRTPYEILTETWNQFRPTNDGDSLSPMVLWCAVHGVANMINQGLVPADDHLRKRLIHEVCESIIDGRGARSLEMRL